VLIRLIRVDGEPSWSRAMRHKSDLVVGSASQPVEYQYGLCMASQTEPHLYSFSKNEGLSATEVIAHESVTLSCTIWWSASSSIAMSLESQS